ncbi:MAG: hypothetical protein FJX67_19660 [Alphaproteobacteria bacterium]|nr:hypothetical protein [Alphaproteobacteria bacterium]
MIELVQRVMVEGIAGVAGMARVEGVAGAAARAVEAGAFLAPWLFAFFADFFALPVASLVAPAALLFTAPVAFAALGVPTFAALGAMVPGAATRGAAAPGTDTDGVETDGVEGMDGVDGIDCALAAPSAKAEPRRAAATGAETRRLKDFIEGLPWVGLCGERRVPLRVVPAPRCLELPNFAVVGCSDFGRVGAFAGFTARGLP